MSLHNICCIIDFDGFSFRSRTTGKEFLIREIGYIRVDPEFGDFLSRSYRFDLTSYDFGRNNVAWSTINYQTRHVTGLPFKPQPGEKVHSYNLIETCIETIYRMCCHPGRNVVAFKGGISEKNVMESLKIPNLDLAAYGCPKYEDLVRSKMVSSQLIDCGYHQKFAESDKLIHCPRAEVTAFRDWLMLQFPVCWTQGISPNDRCGCGYTAEFSPRLSSADSSSDAPSSSDYN